MLPAGSEIYVPSDQKYYIVEDSCTECRSDITGSGTNSDGSLGVGQDGGPGRTPACTAATSRRATIRTAARCSS
jgi:hypothetical protein